MSTLDLFSAPSRLCFPPPRAFQDKAHDQLRGGVIAGHRTQIVCAPTGAGKLYLGLRICHEALKRKRPDGKPQRALFVCDRKTLIDQADFKALEYGMQPAGIIQADNPRFDLTRPFQIASAQTLEARGVADDWDVIVIDECHTLYDVVTKLIASTQARVVGLSATPFTKGLGNHYSNLINAATMAELVDSGVLVLPRFMSCVRPDMEGAKTSGGEWTQRAAGERGMAIIGDVVREWLEHAGNAKTICFGSSVTHCEAIVSQFRAAGVEAALFVGSTTDTERKALLEEYRKPDSKIRILVSVEALAKGFDVPDVACICDLRPLRKSFSTYVQIIGRGLRSFPGKQDCLVLDFSGNAIRFAEDFSELYHNGLDTLDAGEKLDREIRKADEKTVKKCGACGFSPCGKKCVKCGFEAKRLSTVEAEPGRAKELDILGNGRKALAATEEALYAMIATHERGKAERRGHGNPKGATAHRFKEITGKWPPRSFNFDDAPTAIPSRALQGKLRSLEIAFAKSRRAS